MSTNMFTSMRTLVCPPGHDVDGLHHRHTGGHHHRNLTAEYGDVARLDRFAGRPEQRFAFGFDRNRIQPLTPQFGLDQDGILRGVLSLDLDAALVGADPQESLHLAHLSARAPQLRGRRFGGGCGGSHD